MKTNKQTPLEKLLQECHLFSEKQADMAEKIVKDIGSRPIMEEPMDWYHYHLGIMVGATKISFKIREEINKQNKNKKRTWKSILTRK